ncbi:MAG: putative Ig domain-containing protein [Actinobacteria bacterium]|nr:putative Ig domain-containing protein [Actinomycetota bacterium]
MGAVTGFAPRRARAAAGALAFALVLVIGLTSELVWLMPRATAIGATPGYPSITGPASAQGLTSSAITIGSYTLADAVAGGSGCGITRVQAVIATDLGTITAAAPTGGTISGSGSATVTLVGSLANVQASLNAATVTSGSAGTATITTTLRPANNFTIGSIDYLFDPSAGHYYSKFDNTTAASWSSMRTSVAAQAFCGAGGYLAIITSAAENTSIQNLVNSGTDTVFLGGVRSNDASDPAGNPAASVGVDATQLWYWDAGTNAPASEQKARLTYGDPGASYNYTTGYYGSPWQGAQPRGNAPYLADWYTSSVFGWDDKPTGQDLRYALAVTTTALTNGQTGVAYSRTLAASGGTGTYTTWAISTGSLPAGLALNAGTGVISGTPTAGGATFSVTVTDSVGNVSAAQSLTITIPPVVTTSTLATGTVAVAYSRSLAASGGTGVYSTWAISTGSLPAGLSLNAASGLVSGTPTAGGTIFTVTVTDSLGATSAAQQVRLVINPFPLVTTTSLPDGTAGTSYGQTLAATAGTGTYSSWAIASGSLPAGLALCTALNTPTTGCTVGQISGTPSASGTSTFTVTVTDSGAVTSASASLTITVAAGGGGGGGGSGGSGSSGSGSSDSPSTPSPSSSSAATPTTPAYTLDAVVTPITQSLPSGGGTVLVNSLPVPATFTSSAPQRMVSVVGTDWSLTLQCVRSNSRPTPLGPNGSLEVVQGQSLRASGNGFATGTVARVFIFQSSRLASQSGESFVIDLGSVPIDSSGNFLGTLPIPATLPPGRYVAQVNGFAADLSVRSTSLPLIVRAASAKTRRLSLTIQFDPLSSALDEPAMKSLRRLARRIPASARKVAVQSVGYVQPTNRRDNDEQLSTARARQVAQAMKAAGVKGRMYVAGRGRSTLEGERGRRVVLTVSYRAAGEAPGRP